MEEVVEYDNLDTIDVSAILDDAEEDATPAPQQWRQPRYLVDCVT